MKRLFKIYSSLLLAAIFAVIAFAPAMAACRSLIVPLDNLTVTGWMTVKAGTRCSARHGLSSGPMLGTVIAERPLHGKATVEYPHRVVYTAPSHYAGPDRFVYVRRGLDRLNKPAVRTVNVVVQVVR
jgi:hypothetical protein